MGDRKEARVKMVLPIRVWGVDGSGQLFNQLAHTLDISRTGARLGGMRGMLAAGDSLTVQYKQKKAQFKVVWVGRPGSVGERQVGLASLEPDKYIWIDIPKEEYRDEFDPAKSPRKRAPAPPPTPPPSTAAAPAPAPAAPAHSADKHEPAIAAEPPSPATPPPPPPPKPATPVSSAAAPPLPAPSDPAAILTQRLKKLTAELIDLQDALKTDEVDPVALQDFRSIVNIIRHYGWVLQQWIEQQKGAEQAFPLAVMLLRERIRLAVQLLQSMSADVAQGIDFEADQMHSLQAAAQELFSQKRLSPATPETAKEAPPLPLPAPPGPIKDLEQELQACDKDLGKGLNLIAERMRLWTGADGAAIALRNGEGMVCQGSVGLAPDVGVPLPEDSPLIGDSLRTGLPASCSDTETDPRVDPEICRSIGLRSTAIVPILHERAACGVLQVFSSTPAVFQPGHIRLLQQMAEVVNEFCLLARS